MAPNSSATQPHQFNSQNPPINRIRWEDRSPRKFSISSKMGRINRFIQRCKLKIDFGRKVDSLLNRCQHLHSPSSPAIQDYLHCSDSHSAHLTALLCTSLLLDTFSHLLLLYSWVSAVCLFFSSFSHSVPIFLFTLHYPRLFRSCLRFFRSIWDPKLLPPLFVQPVRWSSIDFTHRKDLG